MTESTRPASGSEPQSRESAPTPPRSREEPPLARSDEGREGEPPEPTGHYGPGYGDPTRVQSRDEPPPAERSLERPKPGR